MDHYWRSVLAGAWDKTWRPLGWDRKKVALAIIAVAGVIVALVHGGWGAMLTSAVGLLLTAAPIAIAAVVLFAWGFIETQGSLYRDLKKGTDARINELETALARLEKPPPDYTAWRHVDKLTLWQAAFLWCDLEPSRSIPSQVMARLEALKSAVKNGELEFVPEFNYYGNTSEDIKWSTLRAVQL